MNAKKHGHTLATGIDPFSSALCFDGIHHETRPDAHRMQAPVVRARTWLGGVGWRKRGLIRPHEKPS
jgi:hypothetical protein